jgi:1-acyl-sn-glycerol-3-phosphate acyltransferase
VKKLSQLRAKPFEEVALRPAVLGSGGGGRADGHDRGRAWRLVATALCFAAFGASALVLSLLALPVARLLPGGAERRRMRSRRLLGGSLGRFARLMCTLGVLTYEVEGAERLGRPGQLIVANHPTLIDGVFLVSLVPTATCIVKAALARNPLTRGSVAAAEYVSNSAADTMIEGAAEALRSGGSVIMFPEGSRSRPGGTLQFQRGAAAIALRAAAVVTPVYIRCHPPTLAKRDPWYRVPPRRPHFTVRVGADIDPQPFRGGAPPPIAAREFNEHLLRVFTTEFTRADGSIE